MIKTFEEVMENLKSSKYNRYFKELKINNANVPAIVDTGSDISIIRADVFQNLGRTDFVTENNRFFTTGHFEGTVTIDGLPLRIKFLVTDNFVYPAVIGNDILQNVDIEMSLKGAPLKKRKSVGQSDDGDVGEWSEFGEELEILSLTAKDKDVAVDLGYVSKNNAVAVRCLVESYKPEEIDTSPISMKIILSDEIPIFQRPRRISYEDQRMVERQVKEWLRDGIIQISSSEYASPIVLVPKKDGSKRLCCDYRKVNEKIMRENFFYTNCKLPRFSRL